MLQFKKVGWISSRKYPEYNGGAERTDYTIIEAGKKLGLEIDYLYDSRGKDYDFVVLSNVHDWRKEKILDITSNHKLVYFSHDIHYKPFTRELLDRALVSVFMSPLHKGFYDEKFNIKESFLQPAGIIDLDKYYVDKKENYHLFIGDMHAGKGIYELVKYAREHPNDMFKIYGRNMLNLNFELDNFHYYGFLPDEKVPEMLAKAKYFIYLPTEIQPCCRMPLFAYLSDCGIIGNENIGLFSWDWDWKDKEKIKKTIKDYPKKFWTRIDKYYEKIK